MAVGSTPTAPHPLPGRRDGERAPARGAGFDPQRARARAPHRRGGHGRRRGPAAGRTGPGRALPAARRRRQPNLHVYPAADPAGDGWYCYRCGVGGDVIEFVALAEGLDFRAACARLGGQRASAPPRAGPPGGDGPPGTRRRRRTRRPAPPRLRAPGAAVGPADARGAGAS